MGNISGNYDTYEQEIAVVKAYLEKMGIPYKKIEKYDDANAGDVMVQFVNNRYSLFEVKQESEKRFNKYGQYGIDFISSLIFKEGIDANDWKGLHKPEDNEYKEFIETLDTENKNFKWGKIYYSYSDVWLFYVRDASGGYSHLEAYDGKRLHEMKFISYLKNHCEFAVNLKSESQLSNNDKFHSATFFVDAEIFTNIKITKENIYHNSGLIENILTV